MKYFSIILLLISATNSFASSECNQEIERFFSTHAPNTKELLVKGKYTKRSEKSGDFLDCEAPVKKENDRLVLNIDHLKFNPLLGDGAAFWPFGNYPTTDQETDNNRSVNYYSCNANDDGFSIDFSYNERSGWYKSKRYIISVIKLSNGEYEYSLLDGSPSSRIVRCRGSLAEKTNP